MTLRAALALAGCMSVTFSASALEWESRQITISAGPLDEEAKVAFAFVNKLDTAVTITDVHTSCGCTVPALDKRTYAPGERGELRAVFTFNGVTGRQTKHVTVDTDEAGSPAYELTLEVDIPKLYELERYFVVWRKDEPAHPRSLRIRVLRPDLIKELAVESRDARFSTRVEALEEPGVYDVFITPSKTAESMQTSVVVKTGFPAENPRVITLYALVR